MGAEFNKYPGRKDLALSFFPERNRERRKLVLPNEGNEVRQKGRKEFGVAHSTVEAGEPSRGILWREGAAGVVNGAIGGTDSGDTELHNCHKATPMDSGNGAVAKP